MKCLVTGAAGFIGSHLCERLIIDGHTVLGVDDLSNGKLSNLDTIKNSKSFHFMNRDICKLQENPCVEMDWVFHLAAKADIVPSIEFPKRYHDTNVTGTIEMLEFARQAKVKRFLYAASSSCYGIPGEYPTSESWPVHPLYPYAMTKLQGELYVHHWREVYGLEAIALRLFNVYGPRHRTSGSYGAVFGVFLAQLANEKPLTVVGDGEQLRDFTYVSDVVDAFVKAAECEQPSPCMNIGSSKPQSVNYLTKLLGGEVVHIPDRPGEPKITHANINVAIDRLGWQPKVSFEEGVEVMKGLVSQYKEAPLWTPDSIEKATKTWFEHLN